MCQALWRGLQQRDAADYDTGHVQRTDGRQYVEQLRHWIVQQLWDVGGAHRKRSRHHVCTFHWLENGELDDIDDDQAGEILPGDHHKLQQFVRGIDWQLDRRWLHFRGRGPGKRDHGRNFASNDHDSIGFLYSDDDPDLVDSIGGLQRQTSEYTLQVHFSSQFSANQ
jgi:hypothetical protein